MKNAVLGGVHNPPVNPLFNLAIISLLFIVVSSCFKVPWLGTHTSLLCLISFPIPSFLQLASAAKHSGEKTDNILLLKTEVLSTQDLEGGSVWYC